MIGWIVLGALAAFGAFCALWALFGLLLPGDRGGVLVCLCQGNEEALLARCRWLRGLGLLRCPLVLLESSLPEKLRQEIMRKEPNVYFFSLDAYIRGLQEQEGEP